MEKHVEKVVLKEMMKLPDNKVLLLDNLQMPLSNTLGLRWNECLPFLETVINDLSDKNVIRIENLRSGQLRFFKGIEFDDYTNPPQKQALGINIGSFHNSGSAQFGDHNVSNIHLVHGVEQLLTEIEHSTASQEDKETARKKIKAVFENPTVSSVLGAAASSVLELF
ncbi:hypothetical protein KI743_23195 [Vibrio sp. D420a]|jgi:hypothetical protein|uniref:hypothetical protein n=1 Tax=Vibrio sp. D420a TaxID=2836895 RepID=UPI002554C7A9|nr:hypothetical protein [Vibrio sp. D420a]MDK9764916.1 hypothetical protein [Vibrio sp. D420a]